MSETTGKWPFMRQDPDRVVLHPRHGTTPSAKPPVRIFLGTEEAQYRAERVFFFSIEQVRDPSRTYEIYLMKNLTGFDRKRWRTGFTNYRFAIPSFTGGAGKAIYNDVDQIYLADPALLFDMELDGHGYLAIHPKDTSVMLIDCATMLPMWNRKAASAKGKTELTNLPLKKGGLYKKLDGHWNARDVEFVEGKTKCLHYTALHQQPWEPFPEIFSYHPNALGYIWHALDQKADAQGYQVFSVEHPSTEFAGRQAGANRPARRGDASQTIRKFGIKTVLFVTSGAPAPEIDDVELTICDLQLGERWPTGLFDLVLLDSLFDSLPPVDVGWILRDTFAKASKLVWVCVHATETHDPTLGGSIWWRRRLEAAAKPFEEISWKLDVSGAVRASFENRKRPIRQPLVWIFSGTVRDRDMIELTRTLGWNYECKELQLISKPALPACIGSLGIKDLTTKSAKTVAQPWPDLIITGDRTGAAIARAIKDRSFGGTRLVHLGQPQAPFEIFDLILAAPDERLPIRPNVMQTGMSLRAANNVQYITKGAAARRLTLLCLSEPRDGFIMRPVDAKRYAELVGALAQEVQGPLQIVLEDGLRDQTFATFKDSFDGDLKIIDLRRSGVQSHRCFDDADRIVLFADNLERTTQAVASNKEICYFPLPKWHDTVPVVRTFAKFAGLLSGGGRNYRGTPFQQHMVGRLIDRLTVSGISILPRDYIAHQQSLRARGLVSRLGDTEQIASRQMQNELDNAAAQIRAMMAQTLEQRR